MKMVGSKERSLLLTIMVIGMIGSKSIALAAETTITIGASKPATTINPFIYGQFIEHMGRCIHGGIWAQMLYDRKFLLPPNKSWKTIGPKASDFGVAHDTAGTYCGDHAMALWVRDAQGGACGIRQEGLGLIEGDEYVGHAVLCHVDDPCPVTLRLAWDNDPSARQEVTLDKISQTYKKFSFRFRSGATTDNASLSLTLDQPGYLWIACLSLMPADNINGLRADTLELIKELNSPIYRWPGGNFVSGYHWKDGLGPRDRRPPQWERAWGRVEDNDFGVDDFLSFCRDLDTEPLIVVNTGLGSVDEAAEMVEYVNGGPNTLWGARRAEAGHPEPYNVRWWGIGNEMYVDTQLGNVQAERYLLRHNAFVRAMRTADPNIKVIAVGHPGQWNDFLVPRCAPNIDLLSGHHYTLRKMRVPFSPEDGRQYEQNYLVYSDKVAKGVRRLVDDLRARQDGSDPAIDRIRLSIDEWGIAREWHPDPDGPGIGMYEIYYPLGDAIACGRALHELIRSADLVEIAQWPQTVNVLGAIKTNRTDAIMGSVGHLLTLYRSRVGGRLLPSEVSNDAPIDVVAAWDEKTETISVGLINYSPNEEVSVKLQLKGVQTDASAGVWRIHGPSLDSLNVPGEPESITTKHLPNLALDDQLPLPAHSMTVLQIAAQ